MFGVFLVLPKVAVATDMDIQPSPMETSSPSSNMEASGQPRLFSESNSRSPGLTVS